MIVLDTNVLSEEMKPVPELAVHSWLSRQNPLDLFTTAVTEAEIIYGVSVLAGRPILRDGRHAMIAPPEAHALAPSSG